MIDHLSLSVSDLARSGAFYDAALGALGYIRVWSFPEAVGYGSRRGEDVLALKKRVDTVAAPSPGFHIALAGSSTAAVDAFHAAALANGGTDDGAPGLRPDYGVGYYAAFVIDPDGYHLEAVHREPEIGQHWAVVFSSSRANVDPEGYEQAAVRMVELARGMPGFLGVESVRDEGGFGITVSYWRDEASIAGWRSHAEHTAAREQGRRRWYESFEVRVCRVERHYAMRRPVSETLEMAP